LNTLPYLFRLSIFLVYLPLSVLEAFLRDLAFFLRLDLFPPRGRRDQSFFLLLIYVLPCVLFLFPFGGLDGTYILCPGVYAISPLPLLMGLRPRRAAFCVFLLYKNLDFGPAAWPPEFIQHGPLASERAPGEMRTL
jgi:hypothetical protein